jgi:hypothetical protein
MTLAFNPTPIDWSQLAGIGENIGEALKRRQSPMFNPDGSINYNALQQEDPKLAIALAEKDRQFTLDKQKYDLSVKEAESRMGNRTKPTPTAMKAGWEAEDKLKSLSTSRKAIEEAQGYLKEGIYDKATAPAQTALGSTLDVLKIGDAAAYLGLTDKQKAIRTKNFLKIVGPAAMERMATELKGSTAVQEILVYKDLFASETATNEEREAQLRRVVEAIDKDVALQTGRISEIKGAGAAPSDDEYQEGDVADGPNGEVLHFRNGQWVPE